MKFSRSLRTTLAALTIVALVASVMNYRTVGAEESRSVTRFEFTAEKMGVPVRILFYAPSESVAEEAAEAVWARFDELNATLSDWDPESEIIQACRATEASGERAPISADLRRALEESRKFCELTRGAFDPTVSPIVKLWRRSRYFHERPPEKILNEAKSKVGLDVWDLNEDGLRADPGVRFDVGGIAKGIALDEALRVLQARGVRSALVDASGDLRIGDPPPGRAGWRVGVSSLDDRPAFYCELSNVGIATSGDANRYVEIEGVRYSHIIDPRICEPLTTRCVGTVLAPTGTTADALASALCVLGRDEAPEVFAQILRAEPALLDESRFDYLLIEKSGGVDESDDYVVTASPRFLKMYADARASGEASSAVRESE